MSLQAALSNFPASRTVTMKPSRKEDSLLSRNNAKFVLFRNAHDASHLEKEERLLQKEWDLEKSIYLKEREHMLQRRLLLEEKLSPANSARKCVGSNDNIRTTPLPASSRPLPEIRISRSNSSPPNFYDRPTNSYYKPALFPASPLAFSDHLLSAHGFQSNPPSTLANGTRSNLMAPMSVSLPDINATTGKIWGKKQDKKEIRGKQDRTRLTAPRSCEDIRFIADKWKDLRKCRYLRTPTT